MANLKQQILEEVIDALQNEFTKASQESTISLSKTPLTIDAVCESSRAVGNLNGISVSLNVVRELWRSAINWEDK